MADTVAGREYDAALHLLDRQILDPDGAMVANVDDLELTEDDQGRFLVTAILTGPDALGPRLGGRLGHWMVAVWQRLRADEDPAAGRIDIGEVVGVDSAVHIGVRRKALDVDGFEQWTYARIIDAIPGATHDPE
jgi:hypothetical protein